MSYKSPTHCLNEVLLQAAIRAERINAEPAHERRARELAKHNDRLSEQYRRVPAAQTESAANEPAGG